MKSRDKSFKNIILCGLPMSGKTTLGCLIAVALDWAFIDTDGLIEQAYFSIRKKKFICREIFFKEGEGFFRKLEKKQIKSLEGMKHTVIALGGGTLNDPENIPVLKNLGLVIYLKTPSNVLWERINKDDIPGYIDSLNPEKSFQELVEKRTPLYEQSAQFIIETHTLETSQIVDQLLNLLEMSYGK